MHTPKFPIFILQHYLYDVDLRPNSSRTNHKMKEMFYKNIIYFE